MLKRNSVHTTHDGKKSTNGWTIQAPDNRGDQSTHRSEGERQAEYKTCGRKGPRRGKARAVDTVWPCRDGQTGGHVYSVTTAYILCILR